MTPRIAADGDVLGARRGGEHRAPREQVEQSSDSPAQPLCRQDDARAAVPTGVPQQRLESLDHRVGVLRRQSGEQAVEIVDQEDVPVGGRRRHKSSQGVPRRLRVRTEQRVRRLCGDGREHTRPAGAGATDDREAPF